MLGKKGELTAILRGIGALPAEDRPKVGAIANEVRAAVEGALATPRTTLGGAELAARLAAETVDVTTPGRPIRRGSPPPDRRDDHARSPTSSRSSASSSTRARRSRTTSPTSRCSTSRRTIRRGTCGTRSTSTSRDDLLRTHTTPGQIRVMHQERPPIRALLPGRCFRYEAVDASHASEFFQVEGLMIDEGTSMADLKGLLDQFAHAMFGEDRRDPLPAGLLPVHRAVASPSTSCASSATARSAPRARAPAG